MKRLKFTDYNKTHFFFLGGSGGSKAARMASSNTFFKPFCKIGDKNIYYTQAICYFIIDITIFNNHPNEFQELGDLNEN